MDDPDNSTVEDCASEVKEGTPSKKEYSKEELWKFVRKQKKQALLLEEQNKSLKEQLANAAGAQGSAKQGNHAALVTSLREEVEMWKANAQQQMEAVASSLSSVQSNAQDNHGHNSAGLCSENEVQQLRDTAAEAEAEIARLRGKAELAEELQGRVWSLEAELQQTTTDTVEARKQIDSLLRDAGALEHRLLSTQQERDEAVASSAALEEKRLALQRRLQVEGTTGVEGQGLAAEQTREETGETAELKRLVEQLQGALAAADGGRKDGQSGVTVDDGDDGDGNVLRLVEQENGDARQERDRARGELQVLQKETEELRGRVAALVRETEALKAGAEGADARREEEKVTARLEATAAAAEEAAKAAEARASAEATLIQERNHSREERDEARQRVEDGRREFLDAQNIVRELKAEVAGMERERQERADRDEERREELLGALAEAKRRVVLQDEKIEGLTVAEDERVAEVSKLESQAEEQAAAVAELTSARNDFLAQIETRTAELASCTANLEESNLARGALHARVQQLEKVESDKLALQHEAAGLRRRTDEMEANTQDLETKLAEMASALEHAKQKAEEQAAAADGAPEGVKEPEVTAEASEDAPAGSSPPMVTDDVPLSIQRDASTVTDDVEAAAPESARAEALQVDKELLADIETLTVKLKASEVLVHEREEEVKMLSAEMESLKAENGRSEERRLELEGIADQLREKHEAAEARLEKATADAAGAQERVVSVEKSSSEERVALKKSRDYLKAVEDTLAQELEKGRLAVARAAEEESLAKSLREENVSLEKRLEEVTVEAAQAQEALTAARAKAATDASTGEQNARAVSESEAKLSAAEEKMASLLERNKKAASRLRTMKSEKDAAVAEQASTAELLEVSQKKVAEAETRCRLLEEQSSILRQELSTAQQGLQDAESQAADAANQRDAQMSVLVGDAEKLRAANTEIESQLTAVRSALEQRNAASVEALKEQEETTKALYNQLDTANQERDAAVAKVESAQRERETSRGRLKELVPKYKALQAQLKASEKQVTSLNVQAEAAASLEESAGQLQTEVETLRSTLADVETALKDREKALSNVVKEKEEVTAAAKKTKEEMEGKVERLRSMVKKLQRDRQSKDADLAALKAPAVVPKNFCVELRVRGVVLDDAGEESQGVWCLVRPTMPAVPENAGEGKEGKDKLQWLPEEKARSWIAGGKSESDQSRWPTVAQDALRDELDGARAEAEAAARDTAAARGEIESINADFARYKARAHTALKKATSSGAEDRRKDEVLAAVTTENKRLAAELEKQTASLRRQLSDAQRTSAAREQELESALEQLETAQAAHAEIQELQSALKAQERKLALLQKEEEGHSEELSALRAARDELKSQLKAARAQASESSCIVQRLKDELENIARERSDGGWAGQQILSSSIPVDNGNSTSRKLPPALDAFITESIPSSPASTSASATGERFGQQQLQLLPINGDSRDGLQNALGVGKAGGSSADTELMAIAEMARRSSTVEAGVQAELSELRTELAEALLRVEQLSAQEAVLKTTVRSLETDLKTERDLSTGETATINVAYLKTAVVRYMSTRDTGEQRSLLRVISTILQLSKLEATAVEARIAELERTMVGRAGSMVGGAGRRVGGVVGGVMGMVWRGGGSGAAAAEDEEHRQHVEHIAGEDTES